MFRQVKNKLFAHMFIALVLVTGTLCNYDSHPKLKTIKCYVCTAEECGEKPTITRLTEYIRNCTGLDPVCEISMAVRLPDRGCKEHFSDLRLRCSEDAFGFGESCSTNYYATPAHSDSFRKCNDRINMLPDANDIDKPSSTNYCACKKNLCNVGQFEHEPDPETISALAVAHITSNNIFLTVIVTLYLILKT